MTAARRLYSPKGAPRCVVCSGPMAPELVAATAADRHPTCGLPRGWKR